MSVQIGEIDAIPLLLFLWMHKTISLLLHHCVPCDPLHAAGCRGLIIDNIHGQANEGLQPGGHGGTGCQHHKAPQREHAQVPVALIAGVSARTSQDNWPCDGHACADPLMVINKQAHPYQNHLTNASTELNFLGHEPSSPPPASNRHLIRLQISL